MDSLSRKEQWTVGYKITINHVFLSRWDFHVINVPSCRVRARLPYSITFGTHFPPYFNVWNHNASYNRLGLIISASQAAVLMSLLKYGRTWLLVLVIPLGTCNYWHFRTVWERNMNLDFHLKTFYWDPPIRSAFIVEWVSAAWKKVLEVIVEH